MGGFREGHGEIRNGQRDTQTISQLHRIRAIRRKIKQTNKNKSQFERAQGVTGYSRLGAELIRRLRIGKKAE